MRNDCGYWDYIHYSKVRRLRGDIISLKHISNYDLEETRRQPVVLLVGYTDSHELRGRALKLFTRRCWRTAAEHSQFKSHQN